MALTPLTRSGASFQVGGARWVASGMNAYWLGLDDNNGGVTFPSHATITSAFDGMKSMGCNLVRAHTVGISAGTSQSYLTGYSGTTPQYSESNMDSADWAVYQAGLHGIRLMVPLTDNWNYYHSGLWWFVHQAYLQNSSGITDVNGSVKDDSNNRQFFANTTAGLRIRALFKAYITKWLNHVNPYTGLAYKDDPTIAIVETGNEIYYAAQLSSNEWTQDIAATIKATAPNVLVADGSAASGQATSTMPGLTASSVDVVGGHYYPQRASAGYTSQTFTSTDSSFPAGSARQQLAADATAALNASRIFVIGEYPWTRSDIASWYSDIQANSGVDGDMAWSFIGGTEPHGGNFGDDDFPVHYPYLPGGEATYAPALATHIAAQATGSTNTAIVSGATLGLFYANTAIVSGASLGVLAANTAIVSGASLSSTGSANTAQVSGALLTCGALEPFLTVVLPGDTAWTQTAGPITTTPRVLMPAKPSPGTAVTYTQPNGTTLTFNVLPHTIFGRDSNGNLYPIRKRPYLGVPLDVGDPLPTAPSLPTIHIGNYPSWTQVSAVNFADYPDFPIGTLVSQDSLNSKLISGDAASVALRDKVRFYQAGHKDTSQVGTYDPARFSLVNGVLTLNMAVINGVPVGGHFHPVIAGQESNSGAWRLPTPGVRYRICARFNATDPHWGGVTFAISTVKAEDDWSEGSAMSQNIQGFFHNAVSGQDPIGTVAGASRHDYHVYEVIRIPSSASSPSVTYNLDGATVYTNTDPAKIGNDTMSVHFQASTDGTAPAAGSTGKIEILWIEAYQYTP